MTKISTADCKKAIIDWISSNPNYFGHRTSVPSITDVKRISKTKTAAKLNLRKFAITAYCGYAITGDELYALENSDGTITILKDDPDRKWAFSIEIQEEPGEFRDRLVYFYGKDIAPDSHVSFYLQDRLPPSAYETMESAFEFDDAITDESLIDMLVVAGFKFLGYYDMSDDALEVALIESGFATPDDYE